MAQGFEEFFRVATGHRPYAWQRVLAEGGLPRSVRVPSGGGKTAGAVLAWLYRRTVAAPEATARRLVYVLPQGSLAHWTHARTGRWLHRLGLADAVDLHLLAGPDGQNGAWRRHPERSAILVGTHDVLLSRALMRGLADSRTMAPVSFGLLNNDAHWVFDEAGLLGPGLPTGERLQALREALGTTAATGSTWMSAVGDGSAPPAGPGPAPARRIRQLHPDPERYVADLVAALGAAHRPGTRTIAALGSPARARAVHAALRAAHPGRPVALLLPYHRSAELPLPAGESADGFLVVTRALDAGSDLSGRTVLTELAPWSALVQRAGRCNRHGEHPDGGDLLWCVPPEGPGPDDAVARWLTAHEGAAVTAADLFAVDAPRSPVPEPVPEPVPDAPDAPDALGGPELVALFDTARGAGPDGAAPWVQAAADRTVFVAWRAFGPDGPAPEEPEPGRHEQCEAPLAEVTAWLAAAAEEEGDGGGAWLRDRVDGRWRRAVAADLCAGALLLLDAARGGHLPGTGWTPGSRTPVPSLFTGRTPPATACAAWVSLEQHLRETEEEARALTAELPGLTGPQREAVALAARLHDLGKCHHVFQDKLRDGGGDPPEGLLAKSKAPWNNGASSRPFFRHELVTALLLLAGDHWHPPGTDPSLVAYLAAAHHGHVRVTVRPEPGEAAPALFGVRPGDRTPPFALATGERFPALELAPADPFRPDGAWPPLVAALLADPGLGPFRLAHLEALVRTADWRSSARHDGPNPQAPQG